MDSTSNVKYSNPIIIAQLVSKLMEKIKKNKDNAAEIKCLKEKCINSEDATTSLAACKGLIMLVECGILQVYTTLSEVLASLSLAKSYEGIVTAICDLLLLDMTEKINTIGHYKCSFNLQSPQHPLIVILYHHPDLWIEILSKLKYFYNKDINKNSFYANELLYPFYMYVICNPGTNIPEIFQHKLWNFIIRLDQPQSLNIIPYIIAWLQVLKKRNLLRTSDHLMVLCTYINDQNDDLYEVLILFLTSFLYEIIQNKCDPRETIEYLENLIKMNKNTISNSISTLLVLLSECIFYCPSEYLYNLLCLCKTLILLKSSNAFSIQALRVSLLQWIAYECALTSDALQIANDILLHVQNQNTPLCSNNSTEQLYLNKMFSFLKSTNQRIHIVVELNVLSETSSPQTILVWLEKANRLPMFLLKHMQLYFMALFLNGDNDSAIILKTIEILLKIASVHNEIMTQLLTLILYKVSRTTDPEVHFTLLKALPKMAIVKDNLPLILNTLQLVQNGKFGIKSLAMTLFFDLWNIDVKYYTHLQNMLVYTCSKVNESPTQWWEFYVTKAFVLKQICTKNPERYGKELVGHLSDVLNKCNDKNGDLASALALEGITKLCKAGIIDIASTWHELAPRFNGENRVGIIKSFCCLMTEVSYLESCNDTLLNDVMNTLWSYTIHHKNTDVISATYRALGCFTLEQVSMHFPESIKTLSKSDKSLFGLIHGDCWINLLLSCEDFTLDAAGNMLIKFVSQEIAEYHSSIYQIKENQKEPSNFNYLPTHSVVRALGNYIRRQVQKWQDSLEKQAYLQCLHILSQKYSKPIPPVDWCFLQELIHAAEARTYCVTLASHQVQLSGSARRLMENYIAALTEMANTNNDVENIYINLYYLCNSIQPITLRPFLESSVDLALKGVQNASGKDWFKILLLYIKQTLCTKDLHEANKHVLSQIILKVARQIDVDDTLFTNLLQCIVVLPLRYLDELSSPKLWKQTSLENLKISMKIRCALALMDNDLALKWLDDTINAACFMPDDHPYILKCLSSVMKSYVDSISATTWILEFLGHTQSAIANENITKSHLQYLCDIYVVSMVILSGQDIFITSLDDLVNSSVCRLRVFPQSIAQLMTTKYWQLHVAQISEWLFYMVNYEDTPQKYKISFYQALVALKHEKLFELPSKWMKYLGTTIPSVLL